MLVTGKSGNINSLPNDNLEIDILVIEWFETRKRIMHKKTKSGKEITIKMLNENHNLKDGDILWQCKNSVIAVEIKACECIVITPGTKLEASAFCYEIGNKHLPLFYEGNDLIVPFEMPLYNLLQSSGYKVRVEHRKLNTSLRTSVLPHLQVGGTDSTFSKILQLSTSP